MVEVSGRTYPVEIRYREPLAEGERENETDAIIDAVDELSREGPGDILVFLAGERDIRETAEALRKHHPPQTEILPLYARLSAAEQQRVFAAHGARRIVLATNVAETSLTVPGIRYVVDTGKARISRYSYRSKVQRLPIEAVSQASAGQRAGRCGRVAPGVCIRLYSEEDFDNRPEFTEPEILRTNLASVILQMKALKLGDIDDFPFVEKPDRRYINDGYKLLFELGAVDDERALSPLGQRLARLPIEPRFSRMLFCAGSEGALREVLIIVAALSVQDPRERPLEKQQAADEAHRRFQDDKSDFLAWLKLWEYVQEQRRHLTQNKFRKLCKKEFLSFQRLREWQDVHTQLKQMLSTVDLHLNETEADYAAIHRALLSGLISNVALKQEDNEFLGTRNRRFHVFPGSALFKKPPKWLMAAELVETRRVYARSVAAIEPRWLEDLAVHLLKHDYFEPHWQKRSGQVGGYERVSLYGLTLVARRRINFGPIDPAVSRDIFIREALVGQNIFTQAEFFRHNRQLRSELEEMEAKSRRQDVLVDDEDLFRFYDARIPAGVYSVKSFEKWRRQAERSEPRLLFMQRTDVMRSDAAMVSVDDFPATLSLAGLQLPLSYHFAPGEENDGVTVRLPLAMLAQLDGAFFEWLVPGLLQEKIALLIKSLPKQWRRHFVPAPEFARACIEALRPGERALIEAVSAHLQRISGVEVPEAAWRPEQLPVHLFMRFEVVGDDGEVVAVARDLEALQKQWAGAAVADFQRLVEDEWDYHDLTDWPLDALPEQVKLQRGGLEFVAFPCWREEGERVALVLESDPQRAAMDSRRGLRRLFMLKLAQQVKYLRKNLPQGDRLCLLAREVYACEALTSEWLAKAFDQTFKLDCELPITRQQFEQLLAQHRSELVTTANDLATLLMNVFEWRQKLNKKMSGGLNPAWLPALQDMQQQLAAMIYPGFVEETPMEWLRRMPVYLQAMLRRLEKLPAQLDKDRAWLVDVSRLWQDCEKRLPPRGERLQVSAQLWRYRWLLEELRVSLWAQQLGTREPVSLRRLQEVRKQLDK